MAKNKLPTADVTEDPHYHDTWTLLRKYRDVVWSLEVSVRQIRNRFRIDYGKTIEDFLESVYLAGADLSGTELEHQAKCIEQSHKMLCLVDSAVDLMRTKHKNGEEFYWLLYYAYLSRRSCKTSRRSSTSSAHTSATSALGRITGSAKKPSKYSARCCGDIRRRIAQGSCGSFCSKLNICGRDTLKNVVLVNHSTPFAYFTY